MKRFNPSEIEPKWQKIWDDQQVYKADLHSDKPKYYAMSMFNYPSGAGIHIGHAMNYTISDVMARYKRQQGYESYHPVGWDAFGLPAENFAIKTGVSPQETMAKTIPSYHTQYKAMGWSNDWSKEISTHLPEYYKWTQWLFAEMFRAGLAYQDARMQWWCTKCQTVLSNEQVIDGKCWRHDGADDPIVEKKEVKQWFFKITDYADEMLEATDDLNWTESVKLAQKNWIGKSVGAEITFNIQKYDGDKKPNFVILHGYKGRNDKNFVPWLKESLERKNFKVQAPQLPNTENPVEHEQVGFVLENCEINEDTVIVAHSLGAAVAMKVLEKLDLTIKELVLVAPVVEDAFRPDDYAKSHTFTETFDLNYDYEQVVKKSQSRVILSEYAEQDTRRAYIDYLSKKIDAPVQEAEGSKIHFTGDEEPFILESLFSSINVFTTRPDTIFGATFLVVAPEHPIVASLTTDEMKESVEEYVKTAVKKTELERMSDSKEKTGVWTGSYAINPATGEKIPIWVADYVLFGYGTGAIMAVPAHDERDYEFATKFRIPIMQVVAEYRESKDHFEPNDSADTVVRNVADAIITDGNGNYLLQTSVEAGVTDTHFVGGGIEVGESTEEGLKREILEETGYDEILSVKQISSVRTGKAFRPDKAINHHYSGATYEVIVSPQHQVANESDEGKHVLTWVKKEDVFKALTWESHAEVWQRYVDDAPADFYDSEGVLINSGHFDNMPTSEAREEVVAWLEEQGIGKSKTTYKIRDWSVSRQRYWGAPIPIIHCKKCGPQLVPDDQLPVILPELTDFAPSGDGRSALARATDWLSVTCPNCDGEAERETDTLDTYICSSWYFLRYLDPTNDQAIFDSNVANKWMPVDFYNGADHATAHMIYARFMTRFLSKKGLLKDPEPFKKFLFNGKVTAQSGEMFSKSKGNGVDPLEIINSGYGADALRTYLMFAAPLDTWVRWDPQGVPGTHRFLNRIWNLVQEFLENQSGGSDDAPLKIIHPVIKKVTRDLEHQKYNTAIAAMMKATNDLYELKAKTNFVGQDSWQFALASLVSLVGPFAPHMADELWHELGHDSSLQKDSWPAWEDAYLQSDSMTIIVQINGKLRAKLEVEIDASEENITAMALEDESIKKHLAESQPKKIIYIPGRIVNIVI